ncbi:hypothetical protein [Streptomyces camelliae]|uniref:Uncharacterized protein n=1 Tax=Streptomyces camelliae TaxID=3004093 RepID=A0ABY7PHY9_9ACTN|nr:hypothetical protein [Streptomyces sp. HUAS 2-6]WBO69058.1 hypothetical protein O1G22_43040 [Streptomyces sp. HUAS 2-6]
MDYFSARAYGRNHRLFNDSFTVDGVNSATQVIASLTEVDAQRNPINGGATLHLYDVTPHDNGTVEVRAEIDWDEDLDIRFDFLCANGLGK